MTPAAERRSAAPRVVSVEEVSRLSSGLIRIVFGGDGLAGFTAGEYTDHYVKLHFPPPGADYGPPFDPAEVRVAAPREQWPRTRTHTVRSWDAESRRLTIDFVVHGTGGVAGPWAAQAKPGDVLQFVGPGGAYLPDPEIASHLFVGDESALPAIAASLERAPGGSAVHLVLQVPGPEHEIALPSVDGGVPRWIHGDDERDVLVAVQGLELNGANTQAFVHGEASLVRVVRKHLVVDREIPLQRISASGYWKSQRDDEGWRAEKGDWARLVEADAASA